MTAAVLQLTDTLVIPLSELSFETSRAGGPGGQNVNKVESRVTVVFPLFTSSSLDATQRERIAAHLATRVSRQGLLRVSAQRHRTQAQNREAALARLAELLRAALSEDPERRPTRAPRSARRRRVETKRARSKVKSLRGRVAPDER